MARNKRYHSHRPLSSHWPLLLAGIAILYLVITLPAQLQIVSKGFSTPKVFPTDTLLPALFPQEDNLLKRGDYEAKAIEDLSLKLLIPKEKIHVMKVMEREFADTSLGCPQKDKLYSQVITPGYQIALEALGDTYIYNAGLNIVVTC